MWCRASVETLELFTETNEKSSIIHQAFNHHQIYHFNVTRFRPVVYSRQWVSTFGCAIKQIATVSFICAVALQCHESTAVEWRKGQSTWSRTDIHIESTFDEIKWNIGVSFLISLAYVCGSTFRRHFCYIVGSTRHISKSHLQFIRVERNMVNIPWRRMEMAWHEHSNIFR